MALLYSEKHELGSKAPDFSLPGVDGKTYGLESFQQNRALLIVFMCNHCPYVIAVQDRINALAREYGPKGVAVVGINPNDAQNYPDDSFENMKTRAKEKNYQFSYLQDETQEVARAYGAVCTPDPFVYENVNGAFLLRYQGRIDDSWKDEKTVKDRSLAVALDAILDGKPVDPEQKPSMGCSIKWKN